MKRGALFALFGFLSGSLLGAAVKVGDRAPEIHFDKLVPEQPVAAAGFEALSGKAVVLELWATWCGPCVGAIPHFNELAEKFKDRPVVFLSVTNEEAAVVESFLQKRPIAGTVGIAHTESPWKAYGVEGIPVTFLIDAAGKVAGITHPTGLKASILEDLIAGRKLSLPKPFDFDIARVGDESGQPPLADLIIRPSSDKTPSGMSTGTNRLAMKGGSLTWILASLYDFPQSRLSGEPLSDKTLYDLSFSIPKLSREAFHSVARAVVTAAFHLKVTRETRDTDVWILARTDAPPAALVESEVPSGGSSKSGGGSVSMTSGSVSMLARMLESVAGRPVFDETGLTGKYDFKMTYDTADPQSPVESLRKLGFKVEPARRPIEFLVATRDE